MPGRGRKAVDEELLLALACGFTVEQAAARAGVSAGTLQRRLRDPAFPRPQVTRDRASV